MGDQREHVWQKRGLRACTPDCVRRFGSAPHMHDGVECVASPAGVCCYFHLWLSGFLYSAMRSEGLEVAPIGEGEPPPVAYSVIYGGRRFIVEVSEARE